MSGSIGPWTFDAMRGRMNVAAPTTAPLRSGMRIGRPVAQPASLTTKETATTFGAAWSKAFGYRSAIGCVGRVVDDTGTVCESALIADVSVQIDKRTSGATLVTTWIVIPALWWGANGQATVNVTGNMAGILPINGPSIDATEPEAGYTVQVGTISQTYDSIISTIQPPISDAQREAVRRGSVDLGAEYTPADQVGSARCDVAVAGEEAARDVMKRARYQIGGFGVISIGAAVKLAPIAIADAQATWRPAVGLGGSNDTLVTVTYEARLDDSSPVEDPVAAVTVAIVQVASVWGQWQNVEGGLCFHASDGLSAAAGSTSFTINAVTVTRNKTTVSDLPDHTGKWVRILVRINDKSMGYSGFNGLSSESVTEKTKPIWYGICRSMRIGGGSGSPGAYATYSCSQIQDVLDQIFHTRWYEIGQNNKAANSGKILPFNGDHAGDRSPESLGAGFMEPTVAIATDGARQWYPHQRIADSGSATQPQAWTIRQMVDTLLATALIQYPGGPKWELAGQVTALDVEMPSYMNPNGKSALDQLAELISPRHSLMFRVAVTDEPQERVQLHVKTATPTDIAIAGIGTIPANDQAQALDLSKDGGTATVYKPFNDWYTGTAGVGSALNGQRFPAWELHRDRSRQVDAIYIECGNPWFMATLRIIKPTAGVSSQFDYDWTSTDDTTWTAASTARRADPDLAHVYRRFRIKATWDGRTFNRSDNTILAMGREMGATGESGGFVVDRNENLPNPRTLKLTRTLPYPEGVDLTAGANYDSGSGAMKIARGVSGARPSVFGFIQSSGLYEDLSTNLAVTVDSDCGTIELGHGAKDAEFIQAYLAAGNSILVTIGLIGPLPWRVSWERPDAERPRNLDRAIFLRYPEMQYKMVLQNTIVGISSAGAPRVVPQDSVNDKLLDDANPGAGDRLAHELRMARLWYEDLHRSLSWTQTGVIAFGDDQPPGMMITNATLPLDDRRRFTEAVNAPVTARSWDFHKATLSTSWECDRLAIGFDARVIRLQNAGRQFPEMRRNYSSGET